MTPQDMAGALGKGLLSFPVTTFRRDGSLDPVAYRENIEWVIGHGPAGLFAGGGTGEFFSLTASEVALVVKAAVNEPPYLTEFTGDGLAGHVEAVCRSTRLGVIFYSRASAFIDDATLAQLCERCPNLVGFKDGVGDIEMMTRIYARIGARLTYLGGLPTAETFALPYLEMGVNTYSSAIFNFLPEFAQDFYAAVRRRDHATVYAGLRGFVLPYVDIRNRRKGYAVSIVKAGMRLVGRDCGPVRAPLIDLTEAEMELLASVVGSRR